MYRGGILINVLGQDYARDDFWRRFGNCYVKLVDGSVVQISDINSTTVYVTKYTLDKEGIVEEVTVTIPAEHFNIAQYQAPAGYFNRVREGVLEAVNLKYTQSRQQVRGLHQARVGGLSHAYLVYAYDGFFVPVAEAVQHAAMSGGLCAVSRSIAISTTDVYCFGFRIGAIENNSIVIDQGLLDEYNELVQKENVCLW